MCDIPADPMILFFLAHDSVLPGLDLHSGLDITATRGAPDVLLAGSSESGAVKSQDKRKCKSAREAVAENAGMRGRGLRHTTCKYKLAGTRSTYF